MKRIVLLVLISVVFINSLSAQKLKKIKNIDSQARIFESYEVLADNQKIKHGEYLYRYAGAVQVKGQYLNNLKSGEWIYTPGNYLKIVGSYFKDRKDGEWKYYRNDKLISILNYSRGERIGKSIGYHENGKLASEVEYVDGKMSGIRKSYYDNGLLKSVINYRNGKFDGDYKMYSKNGELWYVLTYTDGIPFNLDIKTDDTDSLFVGGDLKNGSGWFLTYKKQNEGKSLSLLRTYKDGKLNGKIEGYNYKNELSFRGQYLKGYMVGMWTFDLNDPAKRKDVTYTFADSMITDTTKISFTRSISYVENAEEMPLFGNASSNEFRYFISAALKYPPQAQKQGVNGKIYTDFIIDDTGELRDIKIAEGTNVYLEAEALRVLNLSPYWVPGFQDQIPVRVHFTFPIIFKLR